MQQDSGPGAPPSGPGGRPERPKRPRRFVPRRKVCQFCVDKVDTIDYKDSRRLERFVSERGKIEPRRKTGTCGRHQRTLTTALKRARHIALLPFTGAHMRIERGPYAPRGGFGGPPRDNFGPPRENFGPPRDNFGPPRENFGPPRENFGPPRDNPNPPSRDVQE